LPSKEITISPPPGLVEPWRSGLKGAVDLQNQQLIAIRTALEAQIGG
jgi:hypothetical protein